jgi:hypothetical protein
MTNDTPLATKELPIVARAGGYYRNVRYLMVLATFVMGVWFGYDGFVKWPRMNAEHQALVEHYKNDPQASREKSFKAVVEERGLVEHNDMAILFQRVLTFALPLAGIALLIWMLYNSRGEYRFDGTVLHVPGHPPIPVGDISAIDRKRWDRKGIAYLEYATAGGGVGRAKIDDFVYDRRPTDAIFKQVCDIVEPTTDDIAANSASDADA